MCVKPSIWVNTTGNWQLSALRAFSNESFFFINALIANRNRFPTKSPFKPSFSIQVAKRIRTTEQGREMNWSKVKSSRTKTSIVITDKCFS